MKYHRHSTDKSISTTRNGTRKETCHWRSMGDVTTDLSDLKQSKHNEELMSLSPCPLLLSECFLFEHVAQLIGSLCCIFLSHSSPDCKGTIPVHIQVLTLLAFNRHIYWRINDYRDALICVFYICLGFRFKNCSLYKVLSPSPHSTAQQG